ncbi:MAG: hypothetical protein AB1611_06995 [bacterium]
MTKKIGLFNSLRSSRSSFCAWLIPEAIPLSTPPALEIICMGNCHPLFRYDRRCRHILNYMGHAMLFQALHSGNKMAEHITRRIAWKVDLTPQQRKQVEIIVRTGVAGFREIIDSVYLQVEEQFELLHQEVNSLLTEEQKVKWEKHYKKMKDKLNRHRPGPWNSENIDAHTR